MRTGRRGRPRRRPNKLHVDQGYDYRRCWHECQIRSITPRIARRDIESREDLERRPIKLDHKRRIPRRRCISGIRLV